MILGIDHIGLAVSDADGAAHTFARLAGQPASGTDTLEAHGVRVCFVPDVAQPGVSAWNGSDVELLAPLAAETPIGRFLARRGEGMHHVCFAVDNIHAELARLAREGFDLIDHAPRRGHRGLVAFVHPQSCHGVLVELLQRDDGVSHRTGGGLS
jgi:methylmalonyl-CoA/ethylmalonyl-CoA epimerase